MFGPGYAGDVSGQQLVQHGRQVLHVRHQDHRQQGRHRHSEDKTKRFKGNLRGTQPVT